MAKFKGPEYRKFKRITKRVALNIIACNGKKTLPKLNEEVGLNIALGGVLIECSKRLPKKTTLRLKIMPTFGPKLKIMKVPARVVWNARTPRGTYYLGCKFTRLNHRDKIILRRFTFYPWV